MALPFSPDRPLQLHLLGGVKLVGHPEADALLTQTKRVALLAYLAVARPRGYHRRDLIATLFWPEVDTESARTALRKAVHAVRKAIGDEVILSRGDEELALNRDLVWCDVDALEAAGEAGQFLRAVELYPGPLLPGFFADAPGFEQWLEEEREAVRQTALQHALRYVEQLERESNLTMATQWVRKVARLVRFEERVVRKLMQLLARAGARADALKLYDDFARSMRQELDAAPDAETRALADQLRSG